MEVISRVGEYYRVADPMWENPLDGAFSMRFGGRWNSIGSFPVTYLNADLETARANARAFLTRGLMGQPFSADDLDPTQRPVLVSVDIPNDEYLDVVSPTGCVANGLPASYPRDDSGTTVDQATCQAIGLEAWDAELPGIACLSAAAGAPADGEELAWFDRLQGALKAKDTQAFEDWYGEYDW